MSDLRVCLLGTAAGEVAAHERGHSSILIETAGKAYWFDAGEGCTRTAFMLGADLLRTRAVFITHMAMDHIGGLPRLLWTLRKLNLRDPDRPLLEHCIELMLPYALAWRGIMEMLEVTTHNAFARDFILSVSEYHDGVIFDDGTARVTAAHNSHWGEPTRDHGWRSYGLRLDSGTASIAYTGDVEQADEIAGILHEPCDLLLADSSHIDLELLGAFLRQAGNRYQRLALLHQGPEMLRDAKRTRCELEQRLGREVLIPHDGEVLEVRG